MATGDLCKKCVTNHQESTKIWKAQQARDIQLVRDSDHNSDNIMPFYGVIGNKAHIQGQKQMRELAMKYSQNGTQAM